LRSAAPTRGYHPGMSLQTRITSAALALGTCMVGVSLPAAVAHAHVPTLERSAPGTAMAIDGPEVSRAIYGYLAPDETYDAYLFSVEEPVTRTIGVIVPARDEHAEFRPVLRLLTGGTEITTIADPGLSERDTEWEPFSLSTFWEGGEQAISFNPGVEYELRVEPGDDDATSGRYVIVFGGPEAFTVGETMRTLLYLPVIWFGAYGGAPPHWNWWAMIPLGILATGIVLITHLIARRVRTRTDGRTG
jgi:hypothetical protein